MANLVYIVTFALQFRLAGNWKCNDKTQTPIKISIGLADATLRPKILGNRYFNMDFNLELEKFNF